MNQQGDFFEDDSTAPARYIRTPIAYQETSRAAYRAYLKNFGPNDRKIVNALRKGPQTDQEVQTRTKLQQSTVSGNRRHLVQRGYVRDSEIKGKTRSGLPAIKWMLITEKIGP